MTKKSNILSDKCFACELKGFVHRRTTKRGGGGGSPGSNRVFKKSFCTQVIKPLGDLPFSRNQPIKSEGGKGGLPGWTPPQMGISKIIFCAQVIKIYVTYPSAEISQLNRRGEGGSPGWTPPPSNGDFKKSDFVHKLSKFYVTYPSAEISQLNRRGKGWSPGWTPPQMGI